MEHITQITAFEMAHFNREHTSVNRNGLDVPALTGLQLTDDQIISLAGAPRDSTIELSFHSQWAVEEVEYETVPMGLYFSVTSPNYIEDQQEVGIYFDKAAGSYGLYIKQVQFHDRSELRGMAGRMLAIIVRQARRIPGMTEIRLLAAGGRNWDDREPQLGRRYGGFMAWPIYGFDMPLEAKTVAIAAQFPKYPKQLSSCSTIRSVLALQGGKDYWKVVGDGWYMTFDLSSDNSASILALDDVLKEKGI